MDIALLVFLILINGLFAMSEMAQWENLGASVWVRDNTGFAHCLTPAIRGLRPPASYRSGGELPPAGAAQS